MMQDTTTREVAEVPDSRATAGSDVGGPPTGYADLPVTIIEPKRGWLPIDFGELLRYRELLGFLVWRDIKVRYKQTVLGAAWGIIQPVFSMVIFSIIFGSFAKIPSDGLPYPIFVYAGLLPWTFFSNAVSQAGVSLVAQAGMINKIYFPRLFVPMASVGVGLVDFALSFAVYIAIMLYYWQLPGLQALMLPVLVLLTILAASGMGFLLSSVTVVYRDFRHIIPFMMQAWMYASPVVYSVNLVPARYHWLLALNPLTGITDGFRSALLGKPFNWQTLGISSAVTVVLFVFGMYNFRRSERRFADIA